MKLRPLPEIDLARVADKPTELKWSMLRSFKAGGGGWGYEPARSQVFNVFNPVDPIGLRVLQPTLSEIEQSVRNSCREASQEQSCVEVTRLLWDWARENSGGAIERLVPTMSIGQMASVRYWNNFVFLKAGRPTFLFLDHRRSKNLTQNAQRFALSMMHQQIRVADPDFSDAELCILQFPHPKGGNRMIRERFAEGMELYSLDQLQEMVEETYEIWRQINEERRADLPRAASGEGWWG